MAEITPTRCLTFMGMDQCVKPFEHSGEHEYEPRSGAWPEQLIEDKMVSTGIKIERELLARLQKAADERCLGRNLLIRMAVTKFLDELIPIDQLTSKKERGNNEQVQEGNSGGAFGRYLGGGSVWPPDPSGPSNPPGDEASVRGGGR